MMHLLREDPSVVHKAVLDRLMRGLPKSSWSDLFYGSGWSGMENKLTMHEWQEFIRMCADSGVLAADELRIFRTMLNFMVRHGDDGYGDRSADMSRIA